MEFDVTVTINNHGEEWTAEKTIEEGQNFELEAGDGTDWSISFTVDAVLSELEEDKLQIVQENECPVCGDHSSDDRDEYDEHLGESIPAEKMCLLGKEDGYYKMNIHFDEDAI